MQGQIGYQRYRSLYTLGVGRQETVAVQRTDPAALSGDPERQAMFCQLTLFVYWMETH